MDIKNEILCGRTALGLELGSTRIKAVLIDLSHNAIASGEYAWENKFEKGFWTYSIDEVLKGIKACYGELKKNVKQKFDVVLSKIGAIGISAMMHGYLVFDKNDKLLVPFRTWRNNNTEIAASELTKAFNYPIPARWSVAHLYQAVKNNEPHVKDIAFLSTLAGYVHYLLTDKKVVGIGEASGMFPIDLKTHDYNSKFLSVLEALLRERGLDISVLSIMPKVLTAGESGGTLTQKGARLLDVDGDLECGIPLCPPEGDAGTGMVATNSIKSGTGNISAGTSIFGMVVLNEDLKRVHKELDLVTTPVGDLVAMAHCNNCTSEINQWASMFNELLELFDTKVKGNELLTRLFVKSLEGESDCGGLVGYNYVSGENITNVEKGRPLFVRTTQSRFNLANLMRMQVYSAFASLKLGLDILINEERVKINSILAHGGIFKTKGVAQSILSAALNTSVTVNQTANEGGPFGMAVLAMYSAMNENALSLVEYLDKVVFKNDKLYTVTPKKEDVDGFNSFMNNYVACLPLVKDAVKLLKE